MPLSFRKLTYLKKLLIATATGKKNVHFLHIRKTGGTSLKNILSKHLITSKCVLHLHPHRITSAKIPRQHYITFVTRDPVARYVSGFNSRKQQGAPAHIVPWIEGESKAFNTFATANDLALALSPTHSKHMDALHAMKCISHIQCSYWDWFDSPQSFKNDWDRIIFIGRIETFTEDFEELKSALKLPSNASLPADPVSANRSSQKQIQENKLCPEAAALIREWYRRDYEFLELCEQWRNKNQGAVAKFFME